MIKMSDDVQDMRRWTFFRGVIEEVEDFCAKFWGNLDEVLGMEIIFVINWWFAVKSWEFLLKEQIFNQF